MFLEIISAVGAVASIIGVFPVINYGAKVGKLQKMKAAIAGLLFLSLTLTAIATWQFQKNHEREQMENKIAGLLNSWPKLKRFNFVSNGEFRGIIVSGMMIIEEYSEQFPNTYPNVEKMLYRELQVLKKKSDFFEDRATLQEGAETIVTIFKSLSASKTN